MFHHSKKKKHHLSEFLHEDLIEIGRNVSCEQFF